MVRKRTSKGIKKKGSSPASPPRRRMDGRGFEQIRPVKFEIGYVKHAEGSALVSFGRTRVLCNVSVQDGAPSWKTAQGKSGGWVTGEYSMLPRSTHTRNNRETRGLSGRTQEIQRLIGRALRSSVDLDLLGPRTLVVDCDVIEADGGTRTAAITGGYVALRLALNKLISDGLVPKEVHKSQVAAISAGVIFGRPMIDLCYEEDSGAEVDMNVVMNARSEFIEIQGTAEGQPFSGKRFNKLLEFSQKAIKELMALQREALSSAL